MADLSSLSDEDLKHIADGNVGALSDAALKVIAGPAPSEAPKYSEDQTRRYMAALSREGTPGADPLEAGSTQAQISAENMGPNPRDQAIQNFATRVAAPVIGGMTPLGRVGSAVGGALGEYQAQRNEGGKTRPGAIAAAGFVNAIPGGQTLKQMAGRFSGANLAAKTIETGIDEQRLPTAGEAALAAGSGAAGAFLNKALDTGSTASAKLRAKNESVDSLRRQTAKLGDFGEAGKYVIPPSIATLFEGKSSSLANAVDSVGGKAAVAQMATHLNQPITNSAIRQEFGISRVTPLSKAVLDDAAKPFAAVYGEVGSLSPNASMALKEFKQANADKADLFFKYKNAQISKPNMLEAAKTKDAEAAFWLGELRDEANKAGKPDLIPKLQEARTKLAQINLVKESVNDATGDIDAAILGDAFDAGIPLTGNLYKIGRFQNAFAQSVRDAATTPVAGVSQVARYMMPFATGGAAYANGLGPQVSAAATAATMYAPSVARKFALSQFYQNRMAPNYGTATPDPAAQFARVAAQTAGR